MWLKLARHAALATLAHLLLAEAEAAASGLHASTLVDQVELRSKTIVLSEQKPCQNDS